MSSTRLPMLSTALFAAMVLGTCLSISPPSRAESLATSASSAGSSASSAGSASLRGSSDSLKGSSDSSGGDAQVAEGDYLVTDIATVNGTKGMPPLLRLALEPVKTAQGIVNAGASAFTLDLPPRALEVTPLAKGDRVQATHRPYGLSFARAADDQPFFLVLADAWTMDLRTRLVSDPGRGDISRSD